MIKINKNLISEKVVSFVLRLSRGLNFLFYFNFYKVVFTIISKLKLNIIKYFSKKMTK